MATYPIKMLRDENGQPFVPLTSLDAVMGEKNLQYILDAVQVSPGHFRVNYKDLKMKDLVNSIIVIRWPEITSTVKPSYLQLNTETEVILYDGTGTEYLDLEEASRTVNMLAYDGTKWILTSGAGSGSGHVVTDDEGHTMEQQKILNFVGFNVENDTANRATKIINPTPINNLTTTESGQGSLDAYQGNILSKRSVPAGGTKGQVLAKSGNGDHQLEWINQDSDDVITSNGSIEEAISLTYSEYKDMEAAGTLSAKTMYYINDMDNIQWTTLSAEEINEIIDNNQSKLSINGGTLQGNLTIDGDLTVGKGLIVNNGITAPSGFNADYTWTISVNIAEAETWYDTGIVGNMLPTGVYIFEAVTGSYTVNAQYSERMAGVVAWYNGSTNSYEGDLIPLSKSGHARNAHDIRFRIVRMPNPGNIKLQVTDSKAWSGTGNFTIRMKKII